MVNPKGNKKGTRGLRNSASKRSGGGSAENAIPDVYQEMLADAVASSPTRLDEGGRTLKRRRVGGRVVMQGADEESVHHSDYASIVAGDTDAGDSVASTSLALQQTAYNDSDNSADSDMDWEEIQLQGGSTNDALNDSAHDEGPMELTLGDSRKDSRAHGPPKRKPATAAEKKIRLELHKMHLLSLLAHVHKRNHWCNDQGVQDQVKKLLTKNTISYLNPEESLSQFQRSRSFIDGLTQASDAFKREFKITTRGMSRSYWAESSEALASTELPGDLDLPVQKADFRLLARKLEGSRDIGSQLFCALLRSAGAEARLVCSLQPLPFTPSTKSSTPQKPRPVMIIADPESRTVTTDDESGADAGTDTSSRTADIIAPRSLARRINATQPQQTGQSALRPMDNGVSPKMKKARQKRIVESRYPIYWVEAFNAAVQKWIPVDPLVTNTIAKPSKFEPPASDPENNMSYVIAFETDGAARDVTRRYVKAYNAKTRKNRVEVTKGGERWWRRVLKLFDRLYDLDRDQVEDAELAAKEAAEEMPRNVQDFKDHPYYALERHLRRNEVIHPKREVGKVPAGKAGASATDKALESIYRRRDVHVVKSADSWYRLGREIKPGEQPLKRVQPRRGQGAREEDDGPADEDEDGAGTGLYAPFQTVPYEAPPVVNGRIPKNEYGNLDIYASTMVPKGGVHIMHPETARAAKVLGIDYADAVTGFEFRGRRGTAVIKGAVVAAGYAEAVQAVIGGFEDQRAEAEELRRSHEAIRMWKKFMVGLRIRERIEGYDVEGERDVVKEELEKADEEIEDDEGGGFLPDRDGAIAEPTVARSYQPYPAEFKDEGGGFLPESPIGGSDLVAFQTEGHITRDATVQAEDSGEGGFLSETIDEEAEEALRDTEMLHAKGHDIEDFLDKASAGPHDFDEFCSPGEPDQGGGFIIEDDSATNDETPHEEESLPQTAGLGLTDQELAEATMLQQMHESKGESIPHAKMKEEDQIAPLPKEEEMQADDLDVQGTPQQASEIEEQDSPPRHTGSDNEEDRGSLLSHDPEDEDAEPEWLASD
ncbi:MAG: DNA repair Rad4 [Lasallia pustulata]|uniref:DNA repair Rad4 n=1 Tax=Lasallia pustulata TaxID=136370 RepID=A0A5M8PV37_9LECA|nr:MAG: DNA repair Rad4 [Lasallia pustulata]